MSHICVMRTALTSWMMHVGVIYIYISFITPRGDQKNSTRPRWVKRCQCGLLVKVCGYAAGYSAGWDDGDSPLTDCCYSCRVTHRTCIHQHGIRDTYPWHQLYHTCGIRDTILRNQLCCINFWSFTYSAENKLSKSWLILGLRSANERQRYFVTTSFIGWVQV